MMVSQLETTNCEAHNMILEEGISLHCDKRSQQGDLNFQKKWDILQQVQFSGTPRDEIAREWGITEQTIINYEQQYDVIEQKVAENQGHCSQNVKDHLGRLKDELHQIFENNPKITNKLIMSKAKDIGNKLLADHALRCIVLEEKELKALRR